jgi:hypothetical protein
LKDRTIPVNVKHAKRLLEFLYFMIREFWSKTHNDVGSYGNGSKVKCGVLGSVAARSLFQWDLMADGGL